MAYSICRTYRFEASHQLPLLPADHKCFRLDAQQRIFE